MKTEEKGEYERSNDQHDAAAQTGGQLRIGNQLHTISCAQTGDITRAAAVCHAHTGCDGRVDGVET